MGEVPDTLPVTEEARERLRAQANQLSARRASSGSVDLLAIAVEDMRQGGDPRLPLELALVKVTRPGRRSLAGVTRVPARAARAARRRRPPRLLPRLPRGRAGARSTRRRAAPSRTPDGDARTRRRSSSSSSRTPGSAAILPAVAGTLDPGRIAARARRARRRSPSDTLTLEFPASADFHRRQAEEPKNVGAARATRSTRSPAASLAVVLELGEAADADAESRTTSRSTEDDASSRCSRDTFDAQRSGGRLDEQVRHGQADAAGAARCRRRCSRRRRRPRTRSSRPPPAAAWSPSRRTGAGEIVEHHDRSEGDRPGRPGDARRPRARGRQRGAPLGAAR